MEILDLAGLKFIDARRMEEGVAVEVRGIKRLRSVEIGYAVLSFREDSLLLSAGNTATIVRSWRVDFSLHGPSQWAEARGEEVRLVLPIRPPAGLVAGYQGALAATGAKLDVARGSDVWLMYVAPWRGRYSLFPPRGELSVSDGEWEARAAFSVEGERLRGTVEARAADGSKAELVLERRLDTRLGAVMVEEIIARAEPGEVRSFEWRPVRGPQASVLAAMRSAPGRNQIWQLLNALGLPVEERHKSDLVSSEVVVADSDALNYTLKLVLARPWRRKLKDEISMLVNAE